MKPEEQTSARWDSISLDGASTDRWDAVVIGAGPAGTVTARALALAGHRVLLVEKRAWPRFKVCGCCLNGRALAVIDQSGLRPVLDGLEGVELGSVRLHHSGRRLRLPMPQGTAVSREAMDTAFAQAAMREGVAFLTETSAFVEPLTWGASREGGQRDRFGGDGIHDADSRMVELRRTDGETRTVAASVVVVCDGLGHKSLSRLDGFDDHVMRQSRMGLGVIVEHEADEAAYPCGEIQMAVGRRGYVGAVRVERGRLDLAAAVDADLLTKTNPPAAVLAAILEEAGLPVPGGLSGAAVKGTLPLTRSTRRVGEHRLLVLGDATGYVEPFTGEGMAWALSSAAAAAPLAASGIRQWDAGLNRRWAGTHRKLVGDRQRACRLLSRMLRSPRLLSAAMTAARYVPGATLPVVRHINRVPAGSLIR